MSNKKNEDQITQDSSETDIRIILVGKTGAGRSASGNTILGKEMFHAKPSPDSVTAKCSTAVAIKDKKFFVTDTPGFYGSLTEEDIIKQIEEYVGMSVPGPHVFLLVIRLGRFTAEEKKAVKLIQKNFGEDALRYTIILFTHADQLENKSLENYVRQSKDLLKLIESCSGRYHSFNNEDKANSFQVTDLLMKIENMVMQNRGEHYTNEMFENAQKKLINKKRLEKAKDAGLEAATAVSAGAAVAGRVLLGLTEAVVLPAVAVGAEAVGSAVKHLADHIEKKKEKK